MAKDSEMNEIIIIIIAIIIIGAIIIFIFRNRTRNFMEIETEMDGLEFQDRRHIIGGAGRRTGRVGRRADDIQKVQIYS